ncbi:MAG TPA: hypothetical protein VLG47_04495 [Candidatus Saccharimonadales bacterium]|nr:hypothetical protein [Candidatus Saccharimonadales bacterium]
MCPYSGDPQFKSLERHCREPRINLRDDVQVATTDSGQVGESPQFACGSEVGPDRGIPTVSLSYYASTPLMTPDLRAMHERGELPDQQ